MTPSAKQLKLERLRKYLADIPVKDVPADVRASLLAAIGGMNDLIRDEQRESEEALLANPEYSARLFRFMQDLNHLNASAVS